MARLSFEIPTSKDYNIKAFSPGATKIGFGDSMLLVLFIAFIVAIMIAPTGQSNQSKRQAGKHKRAKSSAMSLGASKASTKDIDFFWGSQDAPWHHNSAPQRSLVEDPDSVEFGTANLYVFEGLANPLDVALASDPSTSPDILLGLAERNLQHSIRRCLACNPNSPPELLLKLVKSFPYEVAENTMFMMMLLENPDSIVQMDTEILMAIIKRKNVPQVFINSAIHHPDRLIVKTLLEDPNLSEIHLEHLLERAGTLNLTEEVLRHPNFTDRLKHRVTYESNLRFQLTLAVQCFENPGKASIALLVILFENAPIRVLQQILMTRGMKKMSLDDLFTPDRAQLQYRVAKTIALEQWSYEHFPEHLAAHLAQNQASNLKIRILIQRTLVVRYLEDPLLETLSCNPYGKVRGAIAKLAGLPEEMLFRLAEDDSNIVQNNLVKNSNIEEEILAKMSQSTRYSLRVLEMVARHPNTPIATLQELAQQPQLRQHIARNPSTPIETLKVLAESEECDIALTQNPTIPNDLVQPILAKLAIDPRYTVRKLVARHPQTPQTLLAQLAQDPETKVASLAQLRLTA